MSLPLDWFTIEVNCHPDFVSAYWPNGYWQRYSKKYTSLRRAQQALPYIQSFLPTWGTRIVTCHKPVSCEERLLLGIPPFDQGEVIEVHIPPKTL